MSGPGRNDWREFCRPDLSRGPAARRRSALIPNFKRTPKVYVDTVQKFARTGGGKGRWFSKHPVGFMRAAARAGIAVGFGVVTFLISQSAE